MERIDYKTACKSIHKKITSIRFDKLPISDYNKGYINGLLPALDYFLKIYTACFKEGLSQCTKKAEDITLVDYGGGSGFFSILAKQIGIGKVIYIDLNEKSVEAIRIIKQEISQGPDIILQGDSDELLKWCEKESIYPDLLISTDVIEHIYDLSVFFHDMINLSYKMKMVFTTASTPYNPYVIRRLHRFMKECETGSREKINYYTKRLNFIRTEFPNLSDTDAKEWALATRGLIYRDIKKAIILNLPPLMTDKHNTCDPETGNWAERILPISAYRDLVNPYGYKVTIKKGFYNTVRPQRWKSTASVLMNQLIRFTQKAGLFISPFIILSFVRK